ncbi:UDP-N-acetylmuramoyl-tripeptide--D-alanyl-D-alanine ligase [Desmospora profundinema]|uniref:UDP-N-acetylmuramoyl-tripeptide--D-alanyl-D-alanine ligase n=1 Tax=Desmospora profundinema TaxID=1571184 RepID=A0ABU1IHQ1_9BACL|nr:UDP-N-acetylmuramoyl-tripeptide--D-alanyl-D-alanine ligase [Desmospora profundinema]MDR6224296.1 UDP-N-acetylmuramoyl-tripeptide--D-alanyl-D-alanine ligase [Desmospora profundinema]
MITKSVTLKECVRLIGGTLVRGNPGRVLYSANRGSYRSLTSNQVYFIDTHQSVEKQLAALRNHPVAAVVLPSDVPGSHIPERTAIIRVRSVTDAYWRLASWNWKQATPKHVVGITGSAGKSTTTEMVYAVLKQRARVVHTRGNLNTFTFLPTYLLRLNPGDPILLLEMGMKSLNNIARQCRVVRPNVGVVTNVGEAHAGSLGGLDTVVKAKQELVDGMRPGGILYLNADCARSRQLSTRRFYGTVRTFGIQNSADIRGENIRYGTHGMSFDVRIRNEKFPCVIPHWGNHNVLNALAAIGICLSLGYSKKEIQNGLARSRPPRMRLQLIRAKSGKLLINDAWNANPSAMKAGLTVLKNIAIGTKRIPIAVLGDMMELGRYTYTGHRDVGVHTANQSLSLLVTYGSNSREIGRTAISQGMDPKRVIHYSNRAELIRFLKYAPQNSVIYFKGSRKLKMEKIVDDLARLPARG